MDQIKKETLKEEEIQKILEKMQEEYQIDKVAELVKDNKIEFKYQEKIYRVRFLNANEKDELDMIRRRKFGQLLQDKDILLEKSLINAYKEKGINIEEEIDNKLKLLNAQLADVNYKLGEALVKTPGDTILKTYREEVIDLTSKIRELTIQRGHLLEYSLENHLQNFVAQAISYLSLEIKIEDKWIKAYNSLEEFMKQEDTLIELVGMYSMYLHYR
jgi:hypothetical protein